MALVQSSTWLKRLVGGSRQAWAERLGALVLLAGLLVVLVLGRRLSVEQQVVLWALLVLTAAVLLRRGWLKLFGPVLFYDMVRSARRGRYVLVRCAYAGLLLFFLCSAWASTRSYGQGSGRQEAARLAESFFETFMAVQILAVGLLTPAYVAGAIAEEKERKTLEFLLATDLRNREIVLSKLVARLANLTLFVLTGLPILSFLQFLGGVDPNLVLAGGALTALTMAGLGAISILCSTYFKKPRDAIAITYLGVVAYLALSFLLLWWQQTFRLTMATPVWFGEAPLTLGDLIEGFNTGNLLILLGKLADAGSRGTLATEVPTLLWHYAWFQGVVTALFTGWSVVRVRAIALRQAQGSGGRGLGSLRLWKRPAVSNLPMVWKEVFVEGGVRFSWLGWILVLVLVVVTLLPGLLIIGSHLDQLFDYWGGISRQGRGWYSGLSWEMNAYVRTAGTVVACLLLLGVAVRASTSLSGERAQQTFDALLTSPLDSDAILYGKWLGAMLSVRWAWLWLLGIWGMGVITGGLHLLALPLLLGAWAVYAAFLAALGLWWSMIARSNLRATLMTLIVGIMLAVGHWLPWMCCGPLLFMSSGPGLEMVLKVQAGFTPPAVLAFLAFKGEELHDVSSESMSIIGYGLFGIFGWGVMTVGLGLMLSARFRQQTGRGAYRRPERAVWPEQRPRESSSTARRLRGAIEVADIWEEPQSHIKREKQDDASDGPPRAPP
jgi:ABC-type transport system involved in multi-copper enzyme maturation permease subunit